MSKNFFSNVSKSMLLADKYIAGSILLFCVQYLARALQFVDPWSSVLKLKTANKAKKVSKKFYK